MEVKVIKTIIRSAHDLEMWARTEGWNLDSILSKFDEHPEKWQEALNILEESQGIFEDDTTQTLTDTSLNDFLCYGLDEYGFFEDGFKNG